MASHRLQAEMSSLFPVSEYDDCNPFYPLIFSGGRLLAEHTQ